MNNGFLANLINIFNTRMGDILHALGEHMLITAAAVIFGIIIAVPLGIAMARTKSGLLRTTVFTAANVLQTIPSLALLAILIPLLGIGTKPAIFALFSLLSDAAHAEYIFRIPGGECKCSGSGAGGWVSAQSSCCCKSSFRWPRRTL